MIEYDYSYKYIQLTAGSEKIIIELSKDNMFGEMSYAAKSNLLFFDNDETWGHAVGVGSNEQEALNMCFSEIKNYLNYEFPLITQEVEMPQKFTFIYKRQTVVLYIENCGNDYSILTSKGRKNIITEDIVEFISRNPKEFVKISLDDFSEEFFRIYGFKKPFDAMIKKYKNSEICNL